MGLRRWRPEGRALDGDGTGADPDGGGARLLATEESGAHPEYVAALLGAGAEDAVLTDAFSVMWPPGPEPHRTLRSALEAAERFGSQVAELVDGLTKLDKLHFTTREENQAESFRKMLLAMARDLRVILIKLADRLHNMRTLSSQTPEARERIARET